jgi:hypothetical protein
MQRALRGMKSRSQVEGKCVIPCVFVIPTITPLKHSMGEPSNMCLEEVEPHGGSTKHVLGDRFEVVTS